MRILILDQNNTFFRFNIADPSLSSQTGKHIGGLRGSLKFLQKLCRTIRPDKIIVCWDGGGGSIRKKQIDKSYKHGRKMIRLNRVFSVDHEEEIINRNWQMKRIMEYYDYMPITQILIDEVEADDVIGYITGLEEYEHCEKVIVSNDKDFYQLSNSKTIIYRCLGQKKEEIISTKIIEERYSIHATNMLLLRMIVGDESDNIKGIERTGNKTVSKYFEILKNPNIEIDQLIDYAKQKINEGSKLKIFEHVSKSKEILEKNYLMMQLKDPSISPITKLGIKKMLSDTSDNIFEQYQIEKMIQEDGIGSNLNLKELFSYMNRIYYNNK